VSWLRRLVPDQRQHQRRHEADAGHHLRHAPDPPDLAQSFGHWWHAWCEGEALAAGVVGAAHARDEHEHDDEQHELHEPGLVGEVVDEHLVEQADADGAADCPGNEVIRAISAAERPSSNVSGPIDTSSEEPCAVA